MIPLELRVTDDGSHTLYRPDLDESYHSRFGALTESRHVYIEAGLLPRARRLFPPTSPNEETSGPRQKLTLLEVGLGTGLNALLSAWVLRDFPALELEYAALEPHPLPAELWCRLNYANFLPDPASAAIAFSALHRAPWEQSFQWLPRLQLVKLACELDCARFEENSFDLIYLDAFAPAKQDALWSPKALSKLVSALKWDGCLLSYSANGAFRRNLRRLGCKIEILPGPPPKREMTRAVREMMG